MSKLIGSLFNLVFGVATSLFAVFVLTKIYGWYFVPLLNAPQIPFILVFGAFMAYQVFNAGIDYASVSMALDNAENGTKHSSNKVGCVGVITRAFVYANVLLWAWIGTYWIV